MIRQNALRKINKVDRRESIWSKMMSHCIQIILLFTICLSQFTFGQPSNPPTVRISSGIVQGRLLVTSSGAKGFVFQGIPYVEPPLGNLRFTKPVRKTPWNGTLICNDYKPACPQNASGQTVHKSLSEDCLYVNIFAGVECTRTNLCPVIYYIHGGGYEFDAPSMFAPEVLVENFASKNLIFLTSSYRLGVLGFWSTGTSEAVGNWAMHDMIEGAKWIQREIRNFGGDKSKVTVMGHSSSAMAISLLTMSRKTIGLFDQATIMSGTSCTDHAMSNNLTDYKNVAIRMNCATEKDWERQSRYQSIINCMRKIDPQLLVNEYNEMRSGSSSDSGGSITLPRNDGINGLFPFPLKEMIANRRAIRTMTGTTKNEAGFYKEYVVNATALTTAAICGEIVESMALTNSLKTERKCIEHYVVNANHSDYKLDSPFSFWTEQSMTVMEDKQYFAPCHKEVASLVVQGSTVYLYSFDYEKVGQEGVTPYHSFDLAYVIGLHPFEFDERDKQIQSLYTPLFVNFAKYGDPTPQPIGNVTFKKVQLPFGFFNYLSVDIPLTMRSDYHRSGVIFWNYEVPLINREKIFSWYKEQVTKYKTVAGGTIALTLILLCCCFVVVVGGIIYARKRNARKQNTEYLTLKQSNPVAANGYNSF